MSAAKGVVAAGLAFSVAHLVESSFDLGASKSPTDKRDVPFSYRKMDGGLGTAASVLSIFQSLAILGGKYHAARSVSGFALGFAVTQFLFGGIAYSNKEPGHDGFDLLLAGLQTGFVVFGASYSLYSLPALVVMARERGVSNDQALTKIFMRWHEHGDPAAARELSRIAVQNPYRFAANHSTVLFSDAVDDVSARAVLNKLLEAKGVGVLSSARLLGLAIERRPSLFQSSDLSNLLDQLRTLDNGPALLDKLVASRPVLWKHEVLDTAGKVFKGGDWEKFGDSLRKIWVNRLDEIGRLEYLHIWRGSLLGLDKHQHPAVRDLWKVVDREDYNRFLAEFAETMDEDKLGRAATPLLEDLMRHFHYPRGCAPETTAKMVRIGLMVSERSDVEFAAFDFLWSGGGPQSLRQRALRLLADRATEPHIMKAEAPIMSVTVDGVRQMFGTQVFLRGWFDSREVLVEHNLPALVAVLSEPQYAANPVLLAIARLHHLGRAPSSGSGVKIRF